MSDPQPMIPPSDSGLSQPATYRYPPAYRVQALFGALLFGLIVIGSAIAGVIALQHNPSGVLLSLFGLVHGALILVLGLDIGTRTITTTEQGLQTKWLRASSVPWSDVIGWRYLPLSLIHIRLRHGPGWIVWPIMERYSELLATIDDKVKG